MKKDSYYVARRSSLVARAAGHESRATDLGFTLLEVIVALAIVGISLGVYMSLIGTSFRLKGKVDDHTKKVLFAIQKAEEAHLGLLGDKYASGDNKRVWEGVTEDGVVWKVLESDGRDLAEKNKPVDGITFYDVVAGGMNISSIRSENILSQSTSGQQNRDKKTESKTGSPTSIQKPTFNKKK
ncbi:MAG TPA: prepilin-type N-terminal cleavage/methylation domain-containing protein [Candidatus Brocadiia bacterium]|nr:type II secretion system protein [Planctomycetota bacterium]MBI4007013.1 type II secretion system protein [Planctomycetota bacterium]MDO8093171.1 type II secretion system protein [Candidatus Brocadiales bacterium]